MAAKKQPIQNNKQDFIKLVSKKADTTQDEARKVIDGTLAVINDILAKGESLVLVGFGKFHVVDRAAREGRNPKTGETMKIKASKTPRFTAGKLLKDAANAKKK